MDNCVYNFTKQYIKGVAVQATAILLAAIGAGLFAFFQSIAATTGVCPAPVSNPAEIGALGAGLKAIHSAITMRRIIM